jgi:hypothetical protein
MEATDVVGTVVDPYSRGLNYNPSVVFHNLSLAPTLLSYSHQCMTASGTLTVYDPATGDTGKPFVQTPSDYVWVKWGPGSWPVPVRSGGVISSDVCPGPVQGQTFSLQVSTMVSTDEATFPEQINSATPRPTRVLLDRSSFVGIPSGDSVEVTGTAQYQDDAGTWQPLANTWVALDLGGPVGTGTGGQSDATGRFSITATAPGSSETWKATVGGDFLQSSSSTLTISVFQQVGLYLDYPSIDQFSDLTFTYSVSSTSGHPPNNRVYLLESPDGSTRWKSLGYIPVNGDVSMQQITTHVDNPHGYWMLYSPATPDHPAAYSGVIHTFRYLTGVTGGTPDTNHAYRGRMLTFKGGLWAQGMGSWFRLKHAKVVLAYCPAGSSTWHIATSTSTSAGGYFTLRARAWSNATWAVFFLTPNGQYVDAMGPRTFVRVR